MKRISKIHFFLLLFPVLLIFSCKKPEQFPLVPHIEYKDFVKIYNGTNKDDQGILTITFTDGDGNIGLSPGDTLAPYNPGNKFYYNLFIDYYEKQKGVYTKIDLPFTNNARIPVITPDGEEKSVKGEIDITLFINNILSVYDTICYDITICDRDLNVSNTIRTPDIIVKK